MKVKYIYIILILVLLLISISQIFTIPPYAKDVFPVYKSGYFKELDRGFDVIIDSFLNIKMMSRSVYAWIFLKDIQNKHKYKIAVYNNNGMKVPAPGETEPSNNEYIFKILNSMKPVRISFIKDNKYILYVPVFLEDRCRFCHADANNKNIAGIMKFARDFDSHIYYSSERIIIFIIISLVLIILLYYIIRWEPGKKIRKLFDKQK